jgi:hypothetical protein
MVVEKQEQPSAFINKGILVRNTGCDRVKPRIVQAQPVIGIKSLFQEARFE